MDVCRHFISVALRRQRYCYKLIPLSGCPLTVSELNGTENSVPLTRTAKDDYGLRNKNKLYFQCDFCF
jgi:hypothetical protein